MTFAAASATFDTARRHRTELRRREVNLAEVRPLRPEDCTPRGPARCDFYEGFAWVFDDFELVQSFPARGLQRIFDVPTPSEGIIYRPATPGDWRPTR